MVLRDAPNHTLVWQPMITGECIEGTGAGLNRGLHDEECCEAHPEPVLHFYEWD